MLHIVGCEDLTETCRGTNTARCRWLDAREEAEGNPVNLSLSKEVFWRKCSVISTIMIFGLETDLMRLLQKSKEDILEAEDYVIAEMSLGSCVLGLGCGNT